MQILWWYWLAFGLTLAITELFTPSFFLLWFGVAAIIVSLIYLATPLSFALAVVLWLIFGLVFCALWFYLINPKIKNRTKAGLGASSIIGDVGMVVSADHSGHAGVVRFSIPKAGASEWVYRSNDMLVVGDRVMVLQIIGNELLVGKK